MSFLEKVNSPADLKKLSLRELEAYAEEVREYIISVVGKNGGHLASNLGAVDFTVALHYVFDCPTDKIVFDVGHQSYAHKIITGRAKAFENLRRTGGITGFENMRESKCDAFSTGHSSTSLSVGLGLARARDLAGDDYNVVAVIGDGALTGVMAYEALNDIGASGTRIIIVLNDNKMSISENVGAISAYLGKLRMNKRYRALKTTFKRGIDGIPLLGPTLVKAADKVKRFLKRQFITNKMFEQLGIRYFGTFDGHNIAETVEMFSGLDHIPFHEFFFAYRCDEYVGARSVFFKIRRLGVAYGDGGVLSKQKHGNGFSDYIAAADDHGVLSRDGYARRLDQLDYARGSARLGARKPEHQTARVDDMKTVSVLFGEYACQDLFFVYTLGQRELYQDAVHGGIAIERIDKFDERRFRCVFGKIV